MYVGFLIELYSPQTIEKIIYQLNNYRTEITTDRGYSPQDVSGLAGSPCDGRASSVRYPDPYGPAPQALCGQDSACWKLAEHDARAERVWHLCSLVLGGDLHRPACWRGTKHRALITSCSASSGSAPKLYHSSGHQKSHSKRVYINLCYFIKLW